MVYSYLCQNLLHCQMSNTGMTSGKIPDGFYFLSVLRLNSRLKDLASPPCPLGRKIAGNKGVPFPTRSAESGSSEPGVGELRMRP